MIENLNDKNIESWLSSNKALYILFFSELTPNTYNVKEIFKEFDLKFGNKIQILFCEIDNLQTLCDQWHTLKTQSDKIK